jgi:3-oxoacyl-(acyl-carrier-protein) synthase/SAM-dependent methyltransferase/aryl carrier-like protein
VPATDVMFPNSSMELVQGIYKQNKVADYFNGILGATLVAYVRERVAQDPAARLRILEVGAGTGGTSAMLFELLRPYQGQIEQYCYTDLSQSFLWHGEKEYGAANPYLDYAIFDVSKPLVGQAIEAGSYDVVVATNVLHATPNIRQAVRNAKAALKANGVVLINEISGNHLFAHLTFGLLEGWWMYEDAGRRIPGCPGLYPEAWKDVLSVEGFRQICYPASSAHGLGQQIVVAESDGLVRQPLRVAPSIAPAIATAHTVVVAQHAADVRREENDLQTRCESALKQLVGVTIRMPGHQIDSSQSLANYGVDSILVVQLTQALKPFFQGITSTLLFEFPTIAELACHLAEKHPQSAAAWTGMDAEAQAPTPTAAPKPSKPALRTLLAPGHTRRADAASPEQPMDVAIIGLSGRYPQARNVNELWTKLAGGANCIGEVPADRWNHGQYFDPDRSRVGKAYTKWGGFMDGIDEFDPLFFNIAPHDAELMDPQERLFLQEAYAAIEDAGYRPDGLCETRRVGVFVGAMNGYYPSGARYWSIANRVSYALNLRGPSMAVDTACSSSLTAIHLAVESLRSGSCECAVAGGVNVIIDPQQYLGLASVGMLSAGPECKAFGANADGFVDGEAVGAIVLKPLQKAIADGDHIYGVIKGSMVNAGGKTAGYSVPSPQAQAQVIEEALHQARVDPRTVTYVEAHGTGTPLGDPIEVAGLSRAFGATTGERQFCALGSIKSNIGHCESAAGIAGVTKVLLQMRHRRLVPTLHAADPNPEIDFGSSPFRLQQELTEWPRPTLTVNGELREWPRIASVSSFGAGGANAHLVIAEYVPPAETGQVAARAVDEPSLLVLSARDEERLRDKARQLMAWLNESRPTSAGLADVAYTLQTGREAMEERLAIVAPNAQHAIDALGAYLAGRTDMDGLYRRHDTAHAGHPGGRDVLAAGLLDQWLGGANVDWTGLHSHPRRRVSLPTYPFARERYSMPVAAPQASSETTTTVPAPKRASSPKLHPLLHRNSTSELIK